MSWPFSLSLSTYMNYRLARYSVDPIGTSQGTVTVAGQTWELFAGLNGAMEVYSFVASNTIYNFDASMLDFFTYLPDNMGFPGSSQNLISKIDRFYTVIKRSS